ncbi:MAG: EAL domain-containing protein, partial [Erysipelotrichaceae bacterium]|nr:EAL domain-containing protein [Erysipelotrichaceae bacterium]
MDKEGIIPIEKEKKTILVADDEAINRALLGNILASKYDVLYAVDGEETLRMMEEHKDLLSLVLLDVLMPKKSGFEVLEEVKDKYDIPIIVLTSEAKSEVGCLEMGAVDFIPKPYPDPQVILARAERSIDLNEKSQIIQQTEKDPLTGLYNKEFFYSYAEQHDSHHKDEPMDAILLDINHFHMINERYGSAYGDEVLKRIGEKLEEYVANNGGLACRKDADTFLLYRPHKEDYKNILEVAGKGFSSDELSNRVRMRMGVYSIVDKSLAIERRFDHAKTAADTVKNSYTKMIGIYDDDLHERELYAEQLIEDFSTAIAKEQFQVYYQPKFDVQSDVPFLASAEALVRWIHPKLGMVSPGVFIPLFEENGLIERLDRYVWDKTARQIKDWKEKFGFAIPISVNVSRIDMFDPQMIDVLSDILKKYDLSFDDLILEVTESAYTDDSLQIIDMVKKLRSLGFKIEMDDFGTSYSSLHMISTMPIDAMKLDINFVRNAF